MVASVDHLASAAGVSILQRGGSAADAAVAASAVLAVTTPHMCGMGGDLFALVHDGGGAPLALKASGRAGNGAHPRAVAVPRATPSARLGDGRREIGNGESAAGDFARPLADWVEPLSVAVWDHDVWTIPPNSQGYLTLLGVAIAEQLPLPDSPDDGVWPHLLVEAARAAA